MELTYTSSGGPSALGTSTVKPASCDAASTDATRCASENTPPGDAVADGAGLGVAAVRKITRPRSPSIARAPAGWNATVASASRSTVTAAGTSATDLLATLQAVPGTSVLPKRDVMANDQQIIAGIADQVIMLMVGAAFVVGALVVGMVIYTATIERRGEYGVLKAIGARNGLLYRVVVWQALVAAGLGALFGAGFAFAMGRLVMATRPQFLVTIEPAAIAVTLAAGFAMAIAGGLVPARSVARVAPAEVFRR